MATLHEQLKKAQSLTPKKISKTLFDGIRSIESELIEINTKKQLLKSIDAEGKRLFSNVRKRGTYSIGTELLSGGRKKAGTPYTLEDTGDFMKGFFIKTYNDKAVFSSTDSKTPFLVAEYGEIFGLTDSNLKEVIHSKLLPLFLIQIRKILDL